MEESIDQPLQSQLVLEMHQQHSHQLQQPGQQQLMSTLSSQLEDSMLQAARQLEARVDGAIGAISSSLSVIDAAAQASDVQVCT